MYNFKQKKLFLLDMDGTIYLGDTLFEHTKEFLKTIKDSGNCYAFLTNNSSKGVESYIEKMRKLGIETAKDDYLTSVDCLIEHIVENDMCKKCFYAMGTESFKAQLRGAGLNIVDDVVDGIEGIILAFDRELSFKKLDDVSKLLCLDKEKKLVYLATNPDWVCPTEYGFVPDCGSFSEMLFRATKRRPKFVGKPEPDMVLLALKKFGVSREDAVLVGDRVYTDIMAGVHAGIDTCFVLSGEGTIADLKDEEANKVKEVKPTWVLESIGDILAELKR